MADDQLGTRAEALQAQLASRPKRPKLRKPTDEERAEWRAAHREHEARQRQARIDLLAAVEERDRLLAELEAEIDRVLIAALELGLKSPDLRAILGVSHATFWRRAGAAGWKAEQK